MKTRTTLLLACITLLASCQQPAPRAYGFTPQGPISRGCRYTATWGAPEVHWIDNVNGHRWTCSYADFFKYCGGKHPNEMSIAVKGKLPDLTANTAQPAPAEKPAPASAPTATYIPTYSIPQIER